MDELFLAEILHATGHVTGELQELPRQMIGVLLTTVSNMETRRYGNTEVWKHGTGTYSHTSF